MCEGVSPLCSSSSCLGPLLGLLSKELCEAPSESEYSTKSSVFDGNGLISIIDSDDGIIGVLGVMTCGELPSIWVFADLGGVEFITGSSILRGIPSLSIRFSITSSIYISYHWCIWFSFLTWR